MLVGISNAVKVECVPLNPNQFYGVVTDRRLLILSNL